MFKLQQKKKEEQAKKAADADKPPSMQKQVSVRTRYLTRELTELELPSTCKMNFDNVDDLREFTLVIQPDEGYWKGGSFTFQVKVPEEYNVKPPNVLCKTRIWHPNIAENGRICLSLLREHALDGMGWLPTRTLKDVVWGLNSLFTDLVDFDDPLNVEAAEQYKKSESNFSQRVRSYVDQFAK
ncbi:NEDD8-conjugating enzyme UBE2F-like [Oscarella lobularis]|uniref:NEDD8-conjugating enzyme UBE2F-like n=1 Tax=Oscarella lobularis TaxID=121494 RepID=UPI003313AE6F